MLNWLTSLVWLFACLSLVLAIPVDTLAGNVTSIARRDTASYPYSLQLILSKFPVRRYNWFIFQGPQGIAVDPCLDPKDDPNFERVYFGRELAGEEDDIAHPPFPPSSTAITLVAASTLVSFDAEITTSSIVRKIRATMRQPSDARMVGNITADITASSEEAG
ncbi:hypothetical protein J4E86_000055 [Alternaria arbusti]|uniref:uncharacterized protein n=1 Tax=Alternaria arbusti TaxID=232088 RepID=UPI00221F5E12|nr:uncharacterized protein J4E86_000055 [Alternaria arbusti]KAI4961030.1 hypothetical protein J4E86_000055 [Alternaria arbusti]